MRWALLAVAVSALLALALAVAVPRLARAAQAGSLELGRERPTRLSAEEVARLVAYPHDVTLTYFVSSAERMPSAMRPMERRVREVLSAFQAAAPDRIEARVLDPDVSPAALEFASARRVAPFRVRSVRRDAWSERTVWSALQIAAGPAEPVVIHGVSPEHLPHLRALILEHLEAALDPPRPRVAFDAPPGFDRFAALLEPVADVLRFDLDAGEAIPAGADLLIWIEPRDVSPRTLERVERFRRSGRSVWIAGAEDSVELTLEDDAPVAHFSRRGLDAQRLWSEWGLRVLSTPLFDERAEELRLVDEEVTFPVPFLVRSIAHNHDFRGLPDQPAGTLLFQAPSAFQLDQEALLARGLAPQVLATSSERSFTRDVERGPPGAPVPVPLSDLLGEGTRPLAKQPLIVLLRPSDPWEGALLAMGGSTPLADENFERSGYAHVRLAQILALELASTERLVAARADLVRPELLPPIDGRGRLLLRLAVLLSLPLGLLGLALARGEVQPAHWRVTGLRRAAWALVGIGALALVSGASVRAGAALGLRADLSAGRLESLHPTTLELGRRVAADVPLELVWHGSPIATLAPEQRPGARRALALYETFARAAGLRLVRRDPDLIGPEEREALAARGIHPFRVLSEDGEERTMREVFATLEIRRGEDALLLHFPDALAFEDAEFRLAHALWRLERGRPARIVLATDAPRLSPAEAFQEYQQRQRFAPSGTDVYSLARAALERADFEVVHVEPRLPRMPEGADAVIWLQPRRTITRMLDALVRHLHGGGRALVAAQHFVIQPQQHQGRAFQTVYWPQPQTPDVELHWFPELGVEFPREVLFDELCTALDLVTHVGREEERKDFEAQASALPFLIRANAANFRDDPVTAGVGDLALPFAAWWRVIPERLAELGLVATPIIETSARTWNFAWRGGYLPEELLEGPPRDAEGQPRFQGRRTLMLRLEGPFPKPSAPLFERPEGEVEPPWPEQRPGELLLLSSSELFKNERLLDPSFRADRLLVNAAAHLALPPELAALAGRRAVPRGFDFVEPERRLAWRLSALAGGPAVALLALLGSWILRRRRLAS